MFTAVQHSGNNRQFKNGLMPADVSRKGMAEKIEAAGGILFDDYSAARSYCQDEMFPESYGGLLPKAPGTFTRAITVGASGGGHGSPIYIPVKKVTENQ